MEQSDHRQGGWAASLRGMKARMRKRRRPHLEPLESRPATSITEYSLIPAENNNTNSEPLAIAAGPDGNLWFTDQGSRTAATRRLSDRHDQPHRPDFLPLPTAGHRFSSRGITSGPNNTIWFTESAMTVSGNKIGTINPSTGKITEYPIPTPNAEPVGITLGPDGNFSGSPSSAPLGSGRSTRAPARSPSIGYDRQRRAVQHHGRSGRQSLVHRAGAGKIGMITPSTGKITEFSGLTANALPTGIAAGSDGNIWFTEYNSEKIGMVNLSTDKVTEITTSLTGNSNYAFPGMTAGPDGHLWFTVSGNSSQGAVSQIATMQSHRSHAHHHHVQY